MEYETIIVSVELWNYLSIQSLNRLLQCNKRLYKVLRDKCTWEILIYRDFRRNSKEPFSQPEYRKISDIVTKFSKGKVLTTDALSMLLYFYPTPFHEELLETYTFLSAKVVHTDILSEAAIEILHGDNPNWDERIFLDHFNKKKTKEFIVNLRQSKPNHLDSKSKKYMLYGNIPVNMVPMYVDCTVFLTFDVELVLTGLK